MTYIFMTPNYLDFLHYSLNDNEEIPLSFDEINWSDFLQFCYRQNILGVVYAGLERANKGIPQDVLFEWIGAVEEIKIQNKKANIDVLTISKWFEDRGIRSVILKGQANGLLYPKAELRSPGDIDIWVEGRDIEIIELIRKDSPKAHFSLHHIIMPILNDTSVEVHYSPTHLRLWSRDSRLQKYIDSEREKQFGNKTIFLDNKIGTLTDEFNLVFQLLHMYGHYFSSRNNLKQIIDYYYLLKKADVQNLRNSVVYRLKEFGIYRYASGMMWLMIYLFSLQEDKILVEPDEKFGKILLSDTLNYGIIATRSKAGLLFGRIKDNFHLMGYFPLEVMITPVYILWHQWWKFKMWLRLIM